MNSRLVVLLIATAAGFLLAGVCTLILRGDFTQYFLVMRLLIFIGLPSVVIAISSFVLGCFWKSAAIRWVRAAVGACILVCCIQAIFLPLGALMQQHDIDNAREYCESLIPFLEQHKNDTGTYPQNVEKIAPTLQSLPRLLQPDQFYRSDGDSFRFEFEVPDGLLPTIHTLSSEETGWEEWSANSQRNCSVAFVEDLGEVR